LGEKADMSFDSITWYVSCRIHRETYIYLKSIIKPCPDFAGTGFFNQVITRNVGESESTQNLISSGLTCMSGEEENTQ